MIDTTQVQQLCQLVLREGYSLPDAARTLGMTYRTARRYLLAQGIDPPWRRSYGNLAQYGAYDRKTGELRALGTAKEVATALGITILSLRTYATNGKGNFRIVRLAEPDGEEA